MINTDSIQNENTLWKQEFQSNDVEFLTNIMGGDDDFKIGSSKYKNINVTFATPDNKLWVNYIQNIENPYAETSPIEVTFRKPNPDKDGRFAKVKSWEYNGEKISTSNKLKYYALDGMTINCYTEDYNKCILL